MIRSLALLMASLIVAAGCEQTGTGFRIATAEVVPSEVFLDSIGAAMQLEARVTERDGSLVFGTRTTWSSSDTAVATVDAGGRVVAVAPGVSIITASVSGLRIVDVTATASVEVAQPPAPVAPHAPF